MEFDNPAAGGHWGSQHNSDSDFSDSEPGGGASKKEKNILGSAKKKDKEKKREKEKETKYAHLGEDSSNDDEDGKSSSAKAKKKAFKIGLAKKEKKEKKEREAKEKDLENKELKEAKDAKKKEKKDKPKLKLKKSKHTDSESDKNGKGGEETKWPPIFGVPLQLAVERNRCHDGIQLPVVVRECIDFIEEHGLHIEGIYRSSGVKSKIVKLRTAYSSRQPVDLASMAEPPVVASLLKLFLRELPDPVLTQKLIPNFEEVSKRKVPKQRLEGLKNLLQELPEPNLRLIQWIFVHMGHVIEKEKVNKMTLQNVSIVLSPTMQISHRVLNCIFEHAADLFQGVILTKYVPPISGPTVPLPETPGGIAKEMGKQESLLAELHEEISSGMVVSKAREEQLWEQQRIVTQLKRNLRIAKSKQEEEQRAPAEPVSYEEELNFALQSPVNISEESASKNDNVGEENKVEDTVDSKDAAVLQGIMSSPDDGTDKSQEHRITVQIHQERNENATKNAPNGECIGAAVKDNQEPVKEISKEVKEISKDAKETSKGHVTVIQLNQRLEEDVKDEESPKVPVKSNQVSVPPQNTSTPIAKPRLPHNTSSPFKNEVVSPIAKDVVPLTPIPVVTSTPKPVISTVSSKETFVVPKDSNIPNNKNSNAASNKEFFPPSSKEDIVKDTIDEERVKERVSFSSTGLPSSRPTVNTAIPLLPPPPSSNKASTRMAPQRGLAPPDQRLKSKSLPRGLPSEGMYDNFKETKENAEEAKKNALLQEEMRLKFEYEELLNLKSELERRKKTERREIAELQEEIATMQTLYQYRTYSVDSSEESSEEEDEVRSQEQRTVKLSLLRKLVKEKKSLEERKFEMQTRLQEERSACLQLRTNIRMEQERIKRRAANF